MSNPTGDALAAIGIKDQQVVSYTSISDALRARRIARFVSAFDPSDLVGVADVQVSQAAYGKTNGAPRGKFLLSMTPISGQAHRQATGFFQNRKLRL
jgi:hypothetical protein